MKDTALSIPKTAKIIDMLPPEGLAKLNNFQNYYKVYFKNQVVAGKFFKVNQSTFNRYLSGTLLIPHKIAKQMAEFTQGAVTEEELYFDLKAYQYDMKNSRKQEDKRVS
jgi:hypothetical protein